MKQVRTEDAVGHVLCHDITQIIPGKVKGPVFKKGHVVTEEDIPVLKSVGKEHLYIWEKTEGILHEDEAAAILCKIAAGDRDVFERSEPSEGKIELKSRIRGLFKVRSERLIAINSLGRMMMASIHGNFPVNEGDRLAAMRIIPLVIEEEEMKKARDVAGTEPVFDVLPFKHFDIGIITTGGEVYSGRIKDAFYPVLSRKLSEYDTDITAHTILPDDKGKITQEILTMAKNGADMVIVTGGMSVDPDDRTPGAIAATGAKIISYGTPVLPGAMFLLSYLDIDGRSVPVLGLPGCVMYAGRTVFDLILPRILANDEITGSDLASYGEGGLCLSCDECTFPHCSFGR
ncbi:MAG: molybdopterin-binding protein [Lachnospiraceae bacterium]|nr:molybdopterin-binding protein [Lachnospiraceae bacterium]